MRNLERENPPKLETRWRSVGPPIIKPIPHPTPPQPVSALIGDRPQRGMAIGVPRKVGLSTGAQEPKERVKQPYGQYMGKLKRSKSLQILMRPKNPYIIPHLPPYIYIYIYI